MDAVLLRFILHVQKCDQLVKLLLSQILHFQFNEDEETELIGTQDTIAILVSCIQLFAQVFHFNRLCHVVQDGTLDYRMELFLVNL